jgi:16S rRNA processing protein RimM
VWLHWRKTAPWQAPQGPENKEHHLMMMQEDPDKQRSIIIGRVCGLHGLRGGLKVVSYTRPTENLFIYNPWLVGSPGNWVIHRLLRHENPGKHTVAFLEGIEDRDAAAKLANLDIAIKRSQLPDLPEGEFYWCDLMNLEVRDQDGQVLGRVTDVLDTAPHGVLVVAGTEKILVPLVKNEIIRRVDRDLGVIHVRWSRGYL